MQNKQLFHVIWTTFDEYPVWDKNGNWQKILDIYLELKNNEIEYSLSHELQIEYTNKKARLTKLVLDKKAIAQLSIDIEELCQQNKDRIIDGLEIKMLKITEAKIEMLVFSNIDLLNQKISRLKSRTSTLLSFKYPKYYFGKGTWSKGFWYSTILNNEDLAISIINKQY